MPIPGRIGVSIYKSSSREIDVAGKAEQATEVRTA